MAVYLYRRSLNPFSIYIYSLHGVEQLPPNTSGSEDQFLAAAIAASLEGNAKGSTGADGDGASASMDDGDGGSSSNGHGGGPSSPVRGFVPHDRFSPSPERRTVTESLKLPASSSSSLPPSRLSSSASLSRISTAVAEGSTPASVLASAAASPTTSEATTSEAPQGVQATSDIPDSPNRHTSKRLKGEGSAAHPASVDEDEDSDVAVVGVPVAGDNGGSIKSKGKRKSSEIGSSSDSACGSDGAGSASGKDGATPARASGGYTPGEVVDVSGDDETKESGDANGVSSEVEAVVVSASTHLVYLSMMLDLGNFCKVKFIGSMCPNLACSIICGYSVLYHSFAIGCEENCFDYVSTTKILKKSLVFGNSCLFLRSFCLIRST